jgi:hypothetical protein
LDPFAVGGRFLQIAELYMQYRIHSCVARFRPLISTSGVSESTGAATSTPTYAEREFVMGFTKDPIFIPVSYDNAVEMGGQRGRTSNSVSCRYGSSRWLWCELPGGPTFADYRQCMFGTLFAYYANASTATTPTYGEITLDICASFRWPRDNTISHLAPVFRDRQLLFLEKEEKKEDYVDVDE